MKVFYDQRQACEVLVIEPEDLEGNVAMKMRGMRPSYIFAPIEAKEDSYFTRQATSCTRMDDIEFGKILYYGT